MKAYLYTADDVVAELTTSAESGLTACEAADRLRRNGYNELDKPDPVPLWRRLLSQMADPMIIVLLVAAAISAVVSIGQGHCDYADVAIILTVVTVNAVLGVVQESKAEEALEALREMSAATCKVIRDGKLITCKSRELVCGDIVVLEAGDSVPADCRVLESASMKVEEAALTGESTAVGKITEALVSASDSKGIALADRRNMCFMGSTVVYGRGRVVVTACGMATEVGKIATSIAEAPEGLTPLQLKLAELSRILTKFVIGVCVFIFLISFITHQTDFLTYPHHMLNMFITAVSLAVAAIPEGLVAVVTIALSIGVTRMSKHRAIIRKLTAVETLGCTQIICSDKTGTLTQNCMTVVKHATEDVHSLVVAMALCSDATWDSSEDRAQGEPTEAALVADAARHGCVKETCSEMQCERVGEAPFDSARKMMSVVTRTSSNAVVQYTKGAPDVVLGCCTKMRQKDGTVVELTEAMRAEILNQNMKMAGEALRVLAAASRVWDDAPLDCSPENLECDLVYLGLCGMIDPVRPECKLSIAEARAAGVRTIMITGDHIDTACAIAQELGIINSVDEACEGVNLDRMSDAEFDQRIVNFGVYARVQPEHKVRIVEAWKRRGKVVAMTGDGVNDAPSIKRADIGVGMGITGTDVTKNVADMVLADDNFATIIVAVEEGRRIYDNIKKSIQFLLSSNFAEVICVFVATLASFTILKPVHLLWINLITDSLPALALSCEAAECDVMSRKPRKVTDGLFAEGMWLDCFVQGIVIAVLTLASYVIGCVFEQNTEVISGIFQARSNFFESSTGMSMAFLTLSIVELFYAFNMRSRRLSLFAMPKQNWWLWGAFSLSLVLTFSVMEIDGLARIFGFVPLDFTAFSVAILIAFLIVPLTEIYKAIVRWRERNRT